MLVAWNCIIIYNKKNILTKDEDGGKFSPRKFTKAYV